MSNASHHEPSVCACGLPGKLPEAYEHGGKLVGVATTLGFAIHTL